VLDPHQGRLANLPGLRTLEVSTMTGLPFSVRPFRIIITGGELIREYESSPGNRRAFCSKCGSPLYGLSRTSHPAGA
jgi:hypothetical protein